MQHFGSDVGWRAATVKSQLCRGAEFRKSEVSDFYCECIVWESFNQNVFRLKISVYNAALVQVPDACN